MGKINVSFDTATKAMEVSIDGKSVGDVAEVSLFKTYEDGDGDNPEYGCSILTVGKDESSGVRVYTRLCASESQQGKDAVERGVATKSPLPGFVSVEAVSKVQNAIASYLE